MLEIKNIYIGRDENKMNILKDKIKRIIL